VTEEPALELLGLGRTFGSLAAVDDLSLSVPRGSLLALLGPNGAGKTTTVQMCEGFLRPTSGTVRVLGMDPWTSADRLRPRLGVMLQSGGAHASARTREMLSLIGRCSAHPLDTDWLLAELGLTSVARTPVRRLSGGQVQRLSLAMALIGRPEMLFLDEPTAGLDPAARHLVWDLLRAARADGVTIVLTTHLMDEAELLADQVVIIDHGRAVASGTTAELLGDELPHLRFTAVSGLDLGLLLQALPAGYTAVEVRPGHYRVDGDISPATMATITSWFARVGVLATDLQVGRRSLDDVYLDLTGREIRA